MTRKNWICTLATVLLVSAAPAASRAGNAAATQSSAKKKTTSSKRKSKRAPRGQKTPTSDRIREIQTALNREGALDAKPTGKWDATSIEAMKNYQADQGLNPTGKIDAVTLEKLGLGSDTAGKGAPIPTASSTDPPPTPAR
jgi:murein L,D-transpeptidase YcbB/YkuD